MLKYLSNKTKRIALMEKELEKKLEVKISRKGREITIEGSPEKEYFAEKVIQAIDFGFELNDALMLTDEEYLFEVINIKDHTKKDDLERVRGRIIGTQRKTLDTLTSLTDCEFQLKDNKVAIIGPFERVESAQEAIINLIKGTKQANVYARLEKQQPKPIIDLGLKKDFSKTKI